MWHDYKLILVGTVHLSTGSSVYAGVYVNQILGVRNYRSTTLHP